MTTLNYIIFWITLLYQQIFEGEKKKDIGNEYFSIDIMFPVQVTTFGFMYGVCLSNDNNSLHLESIVVVLKMLVIVHFGIMSQAIALPFTYILYIYIHNTTGSKFINLNLH